MSEKLRYETEHAKVAKTVSSKTAGRPWETPDLKQSVQDWRPTITKKTKAGKKKRDAAMEACETATVAQVSSFIISEIWITSKLLVS